MIRSERGSLFAARSLLLRQFVDESVRRGYSRSYAADLCPPNATVLNGH